MNSENLNGMNNGQTSQPTYNNPYSTQPVNNANQNVAAPNVNPQPAQPTYAAPYVQPNNSMANQPVDPMAAVTSLNKEDAMEEALSHTNQYTPFEAPKQDVVEQSNNGSSKSGYILMIIIAIIMALFIIFLPQISNLFGW